MSVLLIVIFFMIAFFMISAILLQEGKGGGLAATSGAATDSVMGTRNPLRRLTAYCFAIFLVVVIAINYYQSRAANYLSVGEGLIVPTTTTLESVLGDDIKTDMIINPPVAPPPANEKPAAEKIAEPSAFPAEEVTPPPTEETSSKETENTNRDAPDIAPEKTSTVPSPPPAN